MFHKFAIPCQGGFDFWRSEIRLFSWRSDVVHNTVLSASALARDKPAKTLTDDADRRQYDLRKGCKVTLTCYEVTCFGRCAVDIVTDSDHCDAVGLSRHR